jgi:hypothetical protein
VYELSLFIDEDAAVSISIEGDAEVIVSVAYGLLQALRVGRSTAGVDVLAVWCAVQVGYGRSEAFEDSRSEVAARTVCAVEGDADSSEVEPWASMLSEVSFIRLSERRLLLDEVVEVPSRALVSQ